MDIHEPRVMKIAGNFTAGHNDGPAAVIGKRLPPEIKKYFLRIKVDPDTGSLFFFPK